MSQEVMANNRVPNQNYRTKSVLSKVYNDCKIFSSIVFILDKLESDGYFGRIQNCLQSIFDKEMAFAISELRKIKKNKNTFNMHNQLINNTFIFKENLKSIPSSFPNRKIKREDV